MQYLLTEKELDNIHKEYETKINEMNDTILKLCRMVVNNIPVKVSWCSDSLIWGCIIDEKSEYCDECSVQEVCPYKNKHWSK
jgi:hypothetical protein